MTGRAAVPVVGRYALYQAIASGGMATVFLGRLIGSVGFARTVAVKRLHPEYAGDPGFVAMFLDEARVAARIRHPNVVPTLDVVATKGELFLVMDYVHGEVLSKLAKTAIERRQPIPVRCVVSILSGALQGLHAAHVATSERGEPLDIVHRDVSPHNILLGADGQARLLDFGVARAMGRLHTTLPGTVKGKIAYMPPEQLQGLPLGPATDVYSTAVVLWESLVGRTLYRGVPQSALVEAVLTAKVRAPSEVLLEGGDAARAKEVLPLEGVVMRGLARSPEDRWQTALDFARALEAAVPPASAAEVSDWVQRVAGEMLRERAAVVAQIESDSASDASTGDLGRAMADGLSGDTLQDPRPPDFEPKEPAAPAAPAKMERPVAKPAAAPKPERHTDRDENLSLAEERVGTTIAGSYTIARLIGMGGSGAVYQATARNGAQVALKVLHRSVSRVPDVRERFHREALISKRIYHPGVARVLDDGASEDGDVFIAMELLDGESIEERASRNDGKLPMNEVIAIALSALEVLDAAHRVGVVHRDLKPDNLFLTTSRTLKVLDFGIARLDTNDRLTKRTRNGVIMGTPAFMAPEQAKSSWGQVDKRTDVWAMGATMFALLSGRPVHPGESVGEVMAAASMRPAPSLARVIAAPVPLVRVVDRALSFDQHERFADAGEMRSALVECVAEMRDGSAESRAGETKPPGAVAAVELNTLEEREVGGDGGEAGDTAGDPFAIIEATDDQRKTLREFFKLLELGLLSVTQYGQSHPETDKRIALAVTSAVTELARTGATASWNVTPYSFTAGGVPVWEPDTPNDRVPYQLFADGIRIVTIMPGLTRQELDAFLRLVMRDRARELAPEDDFVTLLWEADFEHVTYQAIDSFGSGDLTRRSRFENDVRGIQSLGRAVSRGQIAQSFSKKVPARSAATVNGTLFRLLGRDGVDAASLVSAEAMLKPNASIAPRTALDITAEMKTVLSARLAEETKLVEPKFARSVSLAWMEARTSGAVEALAQKLRAAIDGMAIGRPDAAVRAAVGMCSAAGPSRGALLCAIVSTSTVKKALALAKTSPQAMDVATLATLVEALDGTYFDVVLDAALASEEGPLKELLVSNLLRPGVGNEARLGSRFSSVAEDVGLTLVRILAKVESGEAKGAMLLAAASPHAMVRIEAFGHVEGASSDRMRLELKALLEDADSSLRMTALSAMEKNVVRIAGPSLVLRIKSSKFDSLPVDEKKQALRTLAVLAPRRAEEIAVELLSNAGLLPSEAREQTRILAAELLGRIAQTEAARDALFAAEGARWRSSEPLRAAAETARKRLTKMPPSPWTVPPPTEGPPKGSPRR